MVIRSAKELRREEIRLMMASGAMLSNEMLAQKYGVGERAIRADLAYLRQTGSNKIEEFANEQMVDLFFEVYNGYYSDRQKWQEIINSDEKSRDKEVEANIVKMMSDSRKDQLMLLMKGPVFWNIDRLLKSGKVLNLEKAYPTAIYGEKQKNTHIELAETPTTYSPPAIEKTSEVP